MRFKDVVTGLSSFIVSTLAVAGQNIDFKVANAVIAGNGCLPGTVALNVDEYGDLVADYEDFGIDLPGEGSGSATLSGRSACIIRVPTSIPEGKYIKEISQQALFTLSKSSRAKVSVATRLAIGQIGPATPFTSTYEMGESFDEQFVFASQKAEISELESINFYCNSSRSESQLLQLNLAVSAQKRSSFESVKVQIHGNWIGEGYEIVLEDCPTEVIHPIQ